MAFENDINIRISTLNVRGAKNIKKRQSIDTWAYENKIDILCMQETYCTTNFIKDFDKQWQGKVIHCCSDSNHSKGICIFIKKGLNFELINHYEGENGRKLLINCKINDVEFTFVNLYCPCDSKLRTEFLKHVGKWIKRKSHHDENLVILGDLNTVDSNVDRSSGSLDGSSSTFTNFKTSLNVCDTWKELKPNIPGYTWINPGNLRMRSRIDYVLSTKSLINYVKSITIKDAPVPDHKAIICHLEFSNNKRGSGYWKLNTSILEENVYKQGILNVLQNTISQYQNVLCKRKLWDMCKIRFKEFSIQYSVKRNKQLKSEVQNLELALTNIESKIDLDLTNIEHLKAERSEIKNRLDDFYSKKAKGFQIRSRAMYVAEGERSTGYFLRLEKQRQTSNQIKTIVNDKGDKLNSDEDILEECMGFYKTLYDTTQPSKDNMQKYLDEINIEYTLSENEKDNCEGMVTKGECKLALNKMKLNKSPGLDGLPVEFYRVFWENICDLIIDVYNESFIYEELSDSMNMSVLTLIFKKGDICRLKNYRPISLSTIDYKILACTLAFRMQKVLPKLIHPDQSAYVKGRFIGNNIRLVEDMLFYAEKHKIPGILMFLDFKKAFDSVEHGFILKTLLKINFGEDFIKWVTTIYSNPSAMVKNNGWLSESFSMSRGIRQGCPLSALLFLLVVEILSTTIRNDDKLEGIKIKTNDRIHEIRISQYADDSTVFLKDHTHIKRAIELVNEFGKHSGLILNIDKTEGLQLGSDQNRTDEYGGIRWPTQPIRYLGIYIGYGKKQCDEMNWYQKLMNLEKVLNLWKSRNLTLFGKVCIIKTLAIPKILHSLTNTRIPTDIACKINRLVYSFIWNKTERIKRNTLIGDIQEGGIGMIDIDSFVSAIQASWQSKIKNCKGGSWLHLANYYLNMFGNVSECMNFTNVTQFPELCKIPEFYQQVICSTNKLKCSKPPSNKSEILCNYLWGNVNLSLNSASSGKTKKTLYFKSWIECGFLNVADIMFENGRINEQYIYDNVHDKRNIFGEICSLREVLKPYKRLLGDHHPILGNHTNANNLTILPEKTKDIYVKLRNEKFVKPKAEYYWKNELSLDDNYDFSLTYLKKIKNILDKKIAEFNYKLFNRTMVCGNYLSKWHIDFKAECTVCNHIEDQKHLIFECNHVSDVWKEISRCIKKDICAKDIILGTGDAIIDYTLSIVCFIIYKEWIVCNDKNIKRSEHNILHFVKLELRNKINIYSILPNHEKVVEMLTHIYMYLINY